MPINKLFLVYAFIIFTSACTPTGQIPRTSPHQNKYADRIDEGAQHIRSTYNTSWERTAEGAFVSKQYYPSTGLMTDYLTYADPRGSTLNGQAKKWFDNGTLWQEGQYSNGQRQGQWKFYHYDNASLSEEGAFLDNKRSGVWVSYDTKGNKLSEYEYKEGRYHGAFRVFGEKGQVAREGTYNWGELVDEKVYDVNIAIGVDGTRAVEALPSFYNKACDGLEAQDLKVCSDRKMLETIYSNVRYPVFAREHGIEGTAVIRFVVEKDGSLSEITVLRGLCDPIKKECERVVSMLDKWRPGMQNGEPVRVQFMLPIKYRLE